MFYKLNLKFKKSEFNKDLDISKVRTQEYALPLVNAKDGNNGIMYYGRSCDFDSAEMTIDIVNDGAVSTGNVYPQPQKTGVLYNAYLIKPNFQTTKNNLLFMSCTIQKSIKKKFGYEHKASWERVQEEKIKFPVKCGQIDFDFMEQFVAELEAYLLATGLKDYTLTADEEKALKDFNNVKWKEFDINEIFTVKNTANILSSNIVENSGVTPYLCASAENNGVSSYITYNQKSLEEGNCIFIGGKTFVVSYQEKDFYSNDSHNLALYMEDSIREKAIQLYVATCLYKSLRHKYSWGDSVSKTKIKKDKILLPIKNDNVDYSDMKTFISAIQKLVIKDVVLFADSKIKATKGLTEKRRIKYALTSSKNSNKNRI